MIKYVFKENEKGLVCKLRYSEEDTRYITTYDDFIEILNTIIKENYLVKIKDSDLILQSENAIYIFRDYTKVLEHKVFKHLTDNIKTKIETNGYIDVSTSKSKKYNPKRNSPINKSQIISIGAILLTGTILISLFALPGNKPSSTNVEPKPDLIDMYFGKKSDKNDIAYLDFIDESHTQKAVGTKNNYYHIIQEYSKKLGLDANLMLGIATQERGEHSNQIDEGGGLGLMQIQYDVWVNKTVKYYELNPFSGFYDPHTLTITDEMIKNVDTNIKISCIIMQDCLIRAHYNIPIAIQMYNMGSGTISKVVKTYAKEKGISEEEVYNNPSDLGWLKYVKGNPTYLEKINSWIDKNEFTVVNVFTRETIKITFINFNEYVYPRIYFGEKIRKI